MGASMRAATLGAGLLSAALVASALAPAPSLAQTGFCPQVSLLPLTESITIFEPARADDSRRHVFWSGHLDSVAITCRREENALPRYADIRFAGTANSAAGELITGSAPIFVSLVRRGNVAAGGRDELLEKRIHEQAFVMTAEMDRIAWDGTFADFPIPQESTQERRRLRFFVGFQLDEEQLTYNRRQAAIAEEGGGRARP